MHVRLSVVGLVIVVGLFVSIPTGVGSATNEPPPSTSILIPSNGAALSGSTYLDASASNATSVEFRLFGGIYGYNAPVLCTATLTYYGWLCSWDTTTVPSGSYVLLSEAFNSAGSAFSSGVSITVNNPPSTSILIPSNRAALSGSTYLDASASNATSVEFRLFGGIYGYNAPVLCTATLTYYGWLCSWDTTTVPSGSYVLVSEAFNSAGSAFSSGVGITVNNPPSLVDLTGSFFGTTSYTSMTGGCAYEEQFFDATYPGSSAVGPVTFHLDGCTTPTESSFTYAGTFTIATSVGTLAGDAAGPINVSIYPYDFELTLTVLSGTGAFATTTGILHASIQWPYDSGNSVSGSVTVP